jgi:site-specific recombinase XerD
MSKTILSLESYVQEQYSPKATPGYLSMIKRYVGYSGDKALSAGYTEVLEYIGYLRKTGLHPKSLINNLFSIKIYYRWLNATGQRSDHPCQHLNLQDQVNKKIPVERLYSKETISELLKAHRNKRVGMQRRDEVIITLLLYQALSVQEIAAINTQDVNLNEATIKAKGGCKQKPRTLALEARQILLLHEYITHDRAQLLKKNKLITLDDQAALVLGDTGRRIYPGSVNRMINKGRPKMERLTPLKIRQSVIAHLLKEHTNLRVVQVFAGHSRAGSTEEYKLTGLEELKALVQRLHPLESIVSSIKETA